MSIVGKSFKIYLPAGEQAATEVGSKISPAVPRGNERVLVADDQQQVLAVIVWTVTTQGRRCGGASPSEPSRKPQRS